METVEQPEKTTSETDSEEVITSSLIPDLVIRPMSEEVRRQALAGIPELRALREEILANRGGRPISLEELVGAQHEARAAHERGE
jgi:hypothetical protein